MDTAKIVIVGTGPSGIAAATKLLELGFQNVILLEAENRIGGRINTIPFGDNVIDLGAQWCHGEEDNIVFELAYCQNNLLEHSEDYENTNEYIRSNGEVLPEGIRKRLQGILETCLNSEDLVHFEGHLGDFITKKFSEELQKPENSDIDDTLAKEFFEHFQKLQNAHKASDKLSDLSARDYKDFAPSAGDNLLNWKGKGYLRFLQLLMKSTENEQFGVLENRIQLGKSVKSFNWSGNRVVLLTCADGEVIKADHVIVTVSLGVLKANHLSLFEPKLPEAKIKAIETIGFGTIDKIFLEFPAQFWPNQWSGFAPMWTEEDLQEIRGTSRSWLENVFVFLTVKHQPRLLSGMIMGANARHMETLPKEEVISGCMFLLQKFLKWEVPTPIGCTTSMWHSNQNFRGSYSSRSIKAAEVHAKPADLASPLINSEGKPIILFAGEATNDHHFSTVHGAVESGWREAQRLVELYKV